MPIATSWSTAPDAQSAFEHALEGLLKKKGCFPTFLLLYFTESYSADELWLALKPLPPSVTVQGCTSCLGVMTEEGFHSENGRALGLLGIWDAAGAYGVGMALQSGDARQAAATALTMALANAGRPGELPALVLLNAAPGDEESVLLGIRDAIGSHVPILGGSAADNAVAGRWRLMSRAGVGDDAIVVSVLFPSLRLSYSFQSGYTPTAQNGIATSVSGRMLHTIDHRSAAHVYNAWSGGLLDTVLPDGGNVLSLTALAPLGRLFGHTGEATYYTLSHPEAVLKDGSLLLLSEVAQGQQLFLMTGSRASLVARAGRVTDSAIALANIQLSQIEGGVVVYCAGCMRAVQGKMAEVVNELQRALASKPFIGLFSFGEQGGLFRDQASHGNLMISALIFAH